MTGTAALQTGICPTVMILNTDEGIPLFKTPGKFTIIYKPSEHEARK
jgi:hypothetical protein